MGFLEKPGPSRFTSGMQQVMATQNSSQSGPARPLIGAGGMGYFPPSQLSSGTHRALPPMGSQVSGSNASLIRGNQSQSQVQCGPLQARDPASADVVPSMITHSATFLQAPTFDQQGMASQPSLAHGLNTSQPLSQPAFSQSQVSGLGLSMAHQNNRPASQGIGPQHSPAG